MGPRCERCGGAMPVMARKHARYCSGRCRTAACRSRNPVPVEMRERRRWVRYSARKVPLRLDGRPASSTDEATWSSYAAAKRSRVGAGSGFVLNGDGIVCLDLDHCIRPDGELTAESARIVAAAGGTYIEISPSGDGLHIWGCGNVAYGRRMLHAEMYGSGRYITVTGNRYSGSGLADLSELLTTLM